MTTADIKAGDTVYARSTIEVGIMDNQPPITMAKYGDKLKVVAVSGDTFEVHPVSQPGTVFWAARYQLMTAEEV